MTKRRGSEHIINSLEQTPTYRKTVWSILTPAFTLSLHNLKVYVSVALCILLLHLSLSAGAGYFWKCAQIVEGLLQSWDVPARRERREMRERSWRCEENDCSFIRHYFAIQESWWAPAQPGQRGTYRITTGQQRHNGHTAAKYGCRSSTDHLILFRTYKVSLFTGVTAFYKRFHSKFRLCTRAT